MPLRAGDLGTGADGKGPSLADRIDIIRSVLLPYPMPAEPAVRRLFDDLVARYGAESVFTTLRRRGIAHAALATHGTHAEVADPGGLFQLIQQVSQTVSRIHRKELCRLAESFEEVGVPLISFKGVAMDAALGNTQAPSYSNDIDVLVPKSRVSEARETLHALGYVPGLQIRAGRAYRTPSRVVEMTENSLYSFGQCALLDRLIPVPELESLSARVLEHFGYMFCFSDGRFHLRLSVDLHYSLNHLTDDVGTRVKPSENVWLDDTEKVGIDGVDVVTLSPRVLSWVLPHRLYVDTTLLRDTSLKALCHLKLLWYHGRFEGEHVRDVALRYPYLAPSLYYALRAMDQLCGTQAQPLLEPEQIRTSATPLMNVGDCLPALLGFGVEVTLGALGSGGTADPGVTTLLV